MSTPAQDEYNDLMSRQKPHLSSHPEDFSPSDTSDVDTKYSTTTATSESSTIKSRFSVLSKTHSSIRDSKSRYRDSSSPDDDDEEDHESGARHRHNKKSTYYIPDNIGYNSHTGPKGVIADARAFEDERRAGNKITYRRTEGMHLPKMQHAGMQEQQVRGRSARGRRGYDDDEDEADEEDGDGEFLRSWREKRVRQLRDVKSQSPGGSRMGRYGILRTVDAMGFLEAVETPFRTTVVVYVYDDELLLSQEYQEHLQMLAAKHANVNFIALHYEEAEMEHAGVPALLAYRNGEQFASMTPLNVEVPLTVDVATKLEAACKRYGIF